MQVDSPQPTSTNVYKAGQGSHFQGRKPRQQSKGNPGKGKGKGKGSSKGNPPRSLSRQPTGMQKFSATIVCKHCNKVGHYDSKCWGKHPNLMPQWLKNRQERSKSKTPQRPSQLVGVRVRTAVEVMLRFSCAMSNHFRVLGKSPPIS